MYVETTLILFMKGNNAATTTRDNELSSRSIKL